MKDLAVVLMTCDKYAWLWDVWHYYFRKYWRVDCPVYFCNEIKDVDYDGISQVKCGYVSSDANEWTKQLRDCASQIPEQHVFVILEDLLFDVDITEVFMSLYHEFLRLDADALRVRSKNTRAVMEDVECGMTGIKKLSDRSNYLITFSANLWHKRYLMEVVKKVQSPWAAEASGRMRGKGYRVYDYHLPGWYVNALVLGKLTEAGQRKIREYDEICR